MGNMSGGKLDDETVYLFESTTNGLYEHPLHPTFAVADNAVEIMGWYKNTGKTALAFRKMDGY